MDFALINDSEIKENLISAALKDSRRKAEQIAESVGEKIVGVKEVSESNYHYKNLAKSIVVDALEVPSYLSSTPKADKLDIPEIERSADIDIVWITE